MERRAIDLTAPEAAVALAVLVSFSDDDPSENEGIVLRKYYRYATAKSLQEKLSEAGHEYPTDLPNAEETIIRAIRSAPEAFRLRSLAVAWLLATADGTVDHGELRLLSRYADALGVALADARRTAEMGIAEVDERTLDESADSGGTQVRMPAEPPPLTPVHAGVALACLVAFSDDEPSDREAAVLREFYTSGEVEEFIALSEQTGFAYPDRLPDLEPSIIRALRKQNRDEQLRTLAIAYRIATADETVIAEEEDILRRYCEELSLGLAEVRTFFKSTIE